MENGNGTALAEHKNRLVVHDDSQFAALLDTAKFEHMWRVAQMFSKTKLVPAHFQDKPEDTFIVCQMAIRCGIDPMTMLQNTYIVHGRPGIESKLAIALVNTSGLFADSLDYEIEGGEDPLNDKYRVRAFAVRKSTGKTVQGPWVDWKLVKAEGWDKPKKTKDGKYEIASKWKTMPALMFQYRAAMFFARLHCPERLLGMQTADELQDVYGQRDQETKRVEALPTGKQSLKKPKPEPQPEPQPEPATEPLAEGELSQEAAATADMLDDLKQRIDEAKTLVELEAIRKEYAAAKFDMDVVDELDALSNEKIRESGFSQEVKGV